jgi:thiamine pyrophosphokinase
VIENDKINLTGTCGKYISIFALGGEAHGVSLKGLDYEVENITLTPDFPLGVSNKFTSREAEISVNNGALLVIYER